MTTLDRRTFLQHSTLAGGLLMQPSLRAAEGDMTKIRIGQIGSGHAHAGGKMATLRQLSDHYDVVGVVEPNADLRAKLSQSKDYQGVPILTEEQLLATPGLQAVAVETEVKDLVPTALRCMDAGLHLHVDKPAGESLSAFRSLLKKAEQKQRIVQMGYMFRSNAGFRFAKQAIDAGWLGDVFEVHGVMSKKLSADGRKPMLPYRGGAIFELGCHLIDMLIWLLGKPTACQGFGHQSRGYSDGFIDHQLAVFDFPNATATMNSSMIEVEGERRRQFVICGTQGSIEIRPLEAPKVTLTLDRPQGPYTKGTQAVDLPKMTGRYAGELLSFAECIRGEKKFEFSAEHDLTVHEAVLRVSGLPID